MIGTQWFEVWMMVSFAFYARHYSKQRAQHHGVDCRAVRRQMLVTIMAYLESRSASFIVRQYRFNAVRRRGKAAFAGMTPLFSLFIVFIHLVFFSERHGGAFANAI
ncbi:hypothetical protein PO124_26075 [Bacillus licheniformis]|nr:hypothetical protein [Bacillus licheniformis]